MAALSNDPLGNFNPECTYDINHRASVRLAELAREAGVPRFLYASSYSLYGVAGDAPVTEEADFNPVTPYGESKVRVEQDLVRLADDHVSPTYLRNATAYGLSPCLRVDLVVNSLVGNAYTNSTSTPNTVSTATVTGLTSAPTQSTQAADLIFAQPDNLVGISDPLANSTTDPTSVNSGLNPPAQG